MAKISFQQNPTFKVDVQIPRLGGQAVKVPFVFNYFNRDQMADFTDAEIAYGKEIKELLESEESPTVKEFSARAEELQVGQLKKIISGWGFTEDLSDESISDLVRSSTAVTVAIIEAFKGAFNKAREGN